MNTFTIIGIFGLTVIYLTSVVGCRNWFKIVYSIGGKWWILSPSFLDLFITLFPFVNTVFWLYTTSFPPKFLYEKECNEFFKQFFGIEK